MFSRLNLIVFTMQAVKSAIPVYFLGQIWHQLIFPGAVSIGHSICKAYIIGDHM